MRRPALFVLAAEAALVAAFAVALRSKWMPLGVPGEWEWQRIKVGPTILSVLGAVAAIGCFSAFVAGGFRALSRKVGPRIEAGWLLGLVVASVAVQGVVQEGAPEGYGLSKWIIALITPGSSGYYTVAKEQMRDPARFLADYPAWIKRQDALHVGTHPPGLFLTSRAILGAMEASPGVSKTVLGLAPSSVSTAIRAFRESEGLTRADAAALDPDRSPDVARLRLDGRTAIPAGQGHASRAGELGLRRLLAAGTLGPDVPADGRHGVSTALDFRAGTRRVGGVDRNRPRGLGLCVISGLVLAAGMEFTLAFLPVGLVVALILATTPGSCLGADRLCFSRRAWAS